MTVTISDKHQKFISEQVKKGAFSDADSLIENALDFYENQRQKSLAKLRQAIKEGDESPDDDFTATEIAKAKSEEYRNFLEWRKRSA